jgi:hypothetical protein
MQLTRSELKRLKALHAFHQRPPSWAALLPKALVLIVVWCVLVVGFGILMAGAGSPLMNYCLGLITFFPILGLNLTVRSVRRWPLTDTITNWHRVEELLSTANRPRT